MMSEADQPPCAAPTLTLDPGIDAEIPDGDPDPRTVTRLPDNPEIVVGSSRVIGFCPV
jgi:hypothetical protein